MLLDCYLGGVANCGQGTLKIPRMLQFASCTPNWAQNVAGLKQLYTPVICRSTETWQFRHTIYLFFTYLQTWAWHVARTVDSRVLCRFLVSRSEGKTTLGRPGRRRENNIKMDLKDMWWGHMDCTDLAYYRDRLRAFVNADRNFRVKSNAAKLVNRWETLSFWRRFTLCVIPPSCVDILEIWGHKLLESSGPVQTFREIAINFTS